MIETIALDGTLRAARTAAHPFHFGEDNDTIESVLLNLLRARGDRLVTAESCTAGALGALFSETPGASDVFLGGWITYSNEMKTASLGAPADLIAQHGAVSEPVARAMAEGALRKTLLSPPLPAGEMSESSGTEGESPPRPRGALHALAITGIAGPAGGSPRKPVGTVFIARASSSASPEADSDESSRRRRIPASPDIRRFLITGDRADIRDRSAKLALMMLRFHLLGLDVPRTLWQVQLDGSPFQAR
jgi:nicotinamide-nucleotide amidase